MRMIDYGNLYCNEWGTSVSRKMDRNDCDQETRMLLLLIACFGYIRQIRKLADLNWIEELPYTNTVLTVRILRHTIGSICGLYNHWIGIAKHQPNARQFATFCFDWNFCWTIAVIWNLNEPTSMQAFTVRGLEKYSFWLPLSSVLNHAVKHRNALNSGKVCQLSH